MSLPPSEIPLGAMRFNSDSQKLEYWNGQIWMQIHTFSPNLDGGTRGVFQSGYVAPAAKDTVDYITIPTAGNATDFGNLVTARQWATAGWSSNTRAVTPGGYIAPDVSNQCDYATISSTGNYADFGDLSDSRVAHAGCSNQTRGLTVGGNPVNSGTKTNNCEYMTIATLGATGQDFGDIATATASLGGNIQSPTRSIFFGGYTPTNVNTIEYFTTATLGNATDFGDLTTLAGDVPMGLSNSIRGLRAGGNYSGPSSTDRIDYITIAVLGNAVDFGNLSAVVSSAEGSTASPTRGVFAGIGDPSSNTIDYVSIATEGNAVDFGDLSEARTHGNAVSNGHGGLG